MGAGRAREGSLLRQRAWVALGSNLGDRQENLAFALREIAALPSTRLLECSPLYETDPVAPVGQRLYLNAVASLETVLSPQALLGTLLEIERRAGRERKQGERWSARTLDLDLLLFGDSGGIRIDEPGLRLPHPRLAERAFVLVPLSDVAPDLVHPEVGRTVRELLGALPGAEAGCHPPGVRLFEPVPERPK
jgi:2-amino-4-hydroxy-6-hydroxymethyldihydropteridine diphosphokinase